MRSRPETLRPDELAFEDAAIQRDRGLERERAAAAGSNPAEFRHDVGTPLPGMMVAREAAALPWGCHGAHEDAYPTLVERLLSRVWHVMYTLGDQQQEIARLRENTRQVLARLGTA